MIQYIIIRNSPKFLRWYRIRLTLDWNRLKRYLPIEGEMLDVGCGTGMIDYELAQNRPKLNILGVDVNKKSINNWKL